MVYGKFYIPKIRPQDIKKKKGLLLICDIIGFSNLVLEHNLDELTEIIRSIFNDLEDSISFRLNKEKTLNDMPSLYYKIKKDWSKDFRLNYFFFSDTIFFYPEVDYEIISASYEVSLTFLSTVASIIFEHFEKNYNFIIRGAIVHDEYCIIKNPPTLYGKAVVCAHYLESIQDWGGFLLSPKIVNILQKKKSEILNTKFKRYSTTQIKKSIIDFNQECMEQTDFIYLLDWTQIYSGNPSWKVLLEKAEKIKDKNIRKSAIEKIENTKKHYSNFKKNNARYRTE